MTEKRIVVWIQHFKGRKALMLQWHDPVSGKRRSESASTDDEKEAEQKRSDKEYELNHGLHKDRSRMTWQRFRELFEAEFVTGKRLNTRRGYVATLDLFERICNPRSLKGINERTISLFTAGMRKEPGRRKDAEQMMPSTIKVRLQFLHTALTWAVEQKLLIAVPKFPTIKPPKKDPQPVSPEAFERLLDKAPDAGTRAYLLCGWLAGLRLDEAYSLEWEATEDAPYLDLTRNRIILPAGFVKATKDQWLPIDPDLRSALEALPREGVKVFRFTNSRGKPLTSGGVSQRVVDLAAKAGVRLSMKSLRRGFGCRYAGKVSAHVLQKLMRHANLKTTMDYYANVDDAVMDAVLLGERNTSRNSTPSRDASRESQKDATR